MKVHFWHRNVRDIVVILEEGNLPHPRCPLCDMMVPWKAMNGTHVTVQPGSIAEDTAISCGG